MGFIDSIFLPAFIAGLSVCHQRCVYRSTLPIFTAQTLFFMATKASTALQLITSARNRCALRVDII